MKENSIEEEIKRAVDKFSDNKDKNSAILIVENCILGNYILIGRRTNIVKDSLRYILSDYKRVLKENEELKEYKKIAELTKISCCTAQNCEALNNAIKGELENQKLKEELNDINQKWIQKVKDKIEELKEQDREWTEELSEPDSNFKDIDRNLKRIKNQIDVLQKLLEGRE